jgi:large subunit ribosomal protein L9
MDYLLLKDVDKVGKAGAVVRVKPGFARNYLLPRSLAVSATPAHMRIVEERARRTSRQAARQRQAAEGLKQQLQGLSLTLTLTLGEGGKPFGSVTAHDLVDALAQRGLTIEKHALGLEEPIKALGLYEIPVRVHAGVTATLKVSVVSA